MEYSCLLASVLPIIVARTNPPTTTITPTAEITAIAHTGKPLSVWKKVNGYDEKLKTNGEDIDFIHKIRSQTNSQIIYQPEAKCYHLQDDNIESLSKRVWRYHSFGYKIKKPSLLKLIKLTIKQFKIFIKRLFSNILNFEFAFIYITLIVFFNFVKLEYNNFKNSKK